MWARGRAQVELGGCSACSDWLANLMSAYPHTAQTAPTSPDTQTRYAAPACSPCRSSAMLVKKWAMPCATACVPTTNTCRTGAQLCQLFESNTSRIIWSHMKYFITTAATSIEPHPCRHQPTEITAQPTQLTLDICVDNTAVCRQQLRPNLQRRPPDGFIAAAAAAGSHQNVVSLPVGCPAACKQHTALLVADLHSVFLPHKGVTLYDGSATV